MLDLFDYTEKEEILDFSLVSKQAIKNYLKINY